MSIPLEALEAEVLRLPTAQRKRLLDRVIASLDVDASRDGAWDAVAATREAEAALDPAAYVPLDDVLRDIRAELFGAQAKAAHGIHGKRGPAPQWQQQIEAVSQLPKSQQQFVARVIDVALAQATTQAAAR